MEKVDGRNDEVSMSKFTLLNDLFNVWPGVAGVEQIAFESDRCSTVLIALVVMHDQAGFRLTSIDMTSCTFTAWFRNLQL